MGIFFWTAAGGVVATVAVPVISDTSVAIGLASSPRNPECSSSVVRYGVDRCYILIFAVQDLAQRKK
jgi:hypothetical protein